MIYLHSFKLTIFLFKNNYNKKKVGLAVVNGNLMAIGGFDGTTYLKTVEIYDCESNSWKVNNSMIFRRLGGGCGVIKLQKDSVLLKLPNQNIAPNTNNRLNMANTNSNASSTSTATANTSNNQINCEYTKKTQ